MKAAVATANSPQRARGGIAVSYSSGPTCHPVRARIRKGRSRPSRIARHLRSASKHRNGSGFAERSFQTIQRLAAGSSPGFPFAARKGLPGRREQMFSLSSCAKPSGARFQLRDALGDRLKGWAISVWIYNPAVRCVAICG